MINPTNYRHASREHRSEFGLRFLEIQPNLSNSNTNKKGFIRHSASRYIFTFTLQYCPTTTKTYENRQGSKKTLHHRIN